MKAIRLTKKNRQKILEESPIKESELDQMLKEYDTPYINTALFFIPQHQLAHSLTENSWMTLPWKILNDAFCFIDPK
jgi:hypothetical protein